MVLMLFLLVSTTVQEGRQDADQISQRAAFAEQFSKSAEFRSALKKVSDGSVDKDLIGAVFLVLSHTSETESHRMRGASGNRLYLSPDGKQEAVYDSDGKLVRDGFNDGTYNYFHPSKEPLGHFFFDITPWLLLGQSTKDPTSKTERVEAWCADLCSGIIRARRSDGEFSGDTTRFLTQKGGKETLALFVLILEEGKVDDFVNVLRDQNVSESSVVATVKKIEEALKRVLASVGDHPTEITNDAIKR